MAIKLAQDVIRIESGVGVLSVEHQVIQHLVAQACIEEDGVLSAIHSTWVIKCGVGVADATIDAEALVDLMIDLEPGIEAVAAA